MPTIDAALLLDLLLGVIILFFVPFGVRRGVAKEAMVSAGLLLGVAVAETWANRGAEPLVERFDVGHDTARFVVAVASLGVGLLVLGYGGGAALGRVRQGLLARLAGGVLAAINGALVLAYLLAFVQHYLNHGNDPGVIADGYVGGALLRHLDWLLLGAAGLLAACVVFGLIITAFRHRNDVPVPPSPDPLAGAVPPRQRPVRVAREADAGKYEPTGGASFGSSTTPDPRPGRFGGGTSSLSQTAPLLDTGDRPRVAEDQNRGSAWSRPLPPIDPGHATNGHAPTPPVADDWLRRSRPAPRPDDSDQPPSTAGTRWRPGALDRTNFDALPRRCPSCGAVPGSNDVFCPECGATI